MAEDKSAPTLSFPFTKTSRGLKFALRLTPRASSDRFGGVDLDENDAPILKAGVTAMPENGKANAALIRLLAKTWRVAKTSITITRGASNRRKVIEIAGDPIALAEQFEQWMREKNV